MQAQPDRANEAEQRHLDLRLLLAQALDEGRGREFQDWEVGNFWPRRAPGRPGRPRKGVARVLRPKPEWGGLALRVRFDWLVELAGAHPLDVADALQRGYPHWYRFVSGEHPGERVQMVAIPFDEIWRATTTWKRVTTKPAEGLRGGAWQGRWIAYSRTSGRPVPTTTCCNHPVAWCPFCGRPTLRTRAEVCRTVEWRGTVAQAQRTRWQRLRDRALDARLRHGLDIRPEDLLSFKRSAPLRLLWQRWNARNPQQRVRWSEYDPWGAHKPIPAEVLDVFLASGLPLDDPVAEARRLLGVDLMATLAQEEVMTDVAAPA